MDYGERETVAMICLRGPGSQREYKQLGQRRGMMREMHCRTSSMLAAFRPLRKQIFRNAKLAWIVDHAGLTYMASDVEACEAAGRSFPLDPVRLRYFCRLEGEADVALWQLSVDGFGDASSGASCVKTRIGCKRDVTISLACHRLPKNICWLGQFRKSAPA